MKNGEFVTYYFARTIGIANKMRIHGEVIEDVVIVEKILHSLAPKFDYIVCSIEHDIDTISIDELQSSLMVQEQNQDRRVWVEGVNPSY
ncbi:hypothetical protein L3X38_002858 [Prunus dulcis]|uniref:Uncharacterized protein n=1 Tax=Prunus dulcis TaxID=3755 RepID=A0AAD4WZK5_PRUDU|nr:hypothetical protein L3X38_002858 [Prunus dulcis]